MGPAPLRPLLVVVHDMIVIENVMIVIDAFCAIALVTFATAVITAHSATCPWGCLGAPLMAWHDTRNGALNYILTVCGLMNMR